MYQVRIHGRGGQGVVTAAALLSVAAFLDGRHAQAFPSFGPERMGAPVTAYCRIDDEPIRSHDPVAHPDAVIVQDATLEHDRSVRDGLADCDLVLVNTAGPPPGWIGFGEAGPPRLVTVPAAEAARRATGSPRPNIVLLGALVSLTGAASLDSLVSAVRRRFPGPLADANAEAARVGASLVPGATARA